MRRVPERSVFPLRDLLAEALAGVLQRPGRSLLTSLGTVVGVGAFVAVLGLTSTATGQIGKHFDALRNTTVTVTDLGDDRVRDVGFPADADQRIRTVRGVREAGVHWTVPLRDPLIASTPVVSRGSPRSVDGVPVHAATPGLLAAVRPTVRTGALFSAFHEERAAQVAVLGEAAAARLGITQLTAQPAVFVNGRAFAVVGIIEDTERLPDLLLGVIIPRSTAEHLYEPPDPEIGPARMLIETDVGAGPQVAEQAPVALRPDAADRFEAVPPPDPRSLRDQVGTELSGLFLALAAITLLIGAVGIANTTLVAVLERVGEIGVRRALGARPRHITAQVLAESTLLGTLGGLVGTALGIGTVLAVAITRDWTAVLDPALTLPAPLIGSLTGTVAGLYPALRAATIEPQEALRR